MVSKNFQGSRNNHGMLFTQRRLRTLDLLKVSTIFIFRINHREVQCRWGAAREERERGEGGRRSWPGHTCTQHPGPAGRNRCLLSAQGTQGKQSKTPALVQIPAWEDTDQGHRSISCRVSLEKSDKEKCSRERAVVRAGLTEEVIFEQRLEGGKGAGHEARLKEKHFWQREQQVLRP